MIIILACYYPALKGRPELTVLIRMLNLSSRSILLKRFDITLCAYLAITSFQLVLDRLVKVTRDHRQKLPAGLTGLAFEPLLPPWEEIPGIIQRKRIFLCQPEPRVL